MSFIPGFLGGLGVGGAASLINNAGNIAKAIGVVDDVIGTGLDTVIGTVENIVGVNNNAVSNTAANSHAKAISTVAARKTTGKRKRAGDLSFDNNNIVILPSWSNEIKHHLGTQELLINH